MQQVSNYKPVLHIEDTADSSFDLQSYQLTDSSSLDVIEFADNVSDSIDIIDEEEGLINIKVIGVGGAGGNAVRYMIDRGLTGVEFICINTDQQALRKTKANKTIGIGMTGRGAGAKPDAGRSAAESKIDEIKEVLGGADMVFIAAGMGGGTGTGAAPVIAKVAKELGILTVAVVTKPFSYELGRHRIAEEGLAELRQYVDSIIVVLNDKFTDVLGDDASVDDCFAAANDVLYNACSSVVQIITSSGQINTDFEDVCSVMQASGQAIFGMAEASGSDRAQVALEKAISCPLVEGANLQGATGVLVNIVSSRQIKMSEFRYINQKIAEYVSSDNANIFIGNVYDESMGDRICLTVVATGLGQAKKSLQLVEDDIETVSVLRTGTDNEPYIALNKSSEAEPPSVLHTGRFINANDVEVPAFLRKQAD